MNGQTVEELIEALGNLKGHGIVFPKYTMTGFTPDGSKLTYGYDVEDDERYKGAKK